jgi:SAM-dependent methyltransferase
MSIDPGEGRSLFGLDPQNYDAIRPPYPELIYEFLVSTGALRAGAATLEIGAGSGLATRRLLGYGVNPITLIEPDVRFASLLSQTASQYKADVRIVTHPFEDAPLSHGHFDLVVAATSLHWVQPYVGLRKIADVLKPGGYAALWWHVFGDPSRRDPFHEATKDILQSLTSSPSDPPGAVPYALDTPARLQDFADTGQFDKPAHMSHSWTLVLNTSQVGALYATFSNISRLPEPQRIRVLDQLTEVADREFGGRVERNMVSPVYVARRNGTHHVT